MRLVLRILGIWLIGLAVVLLVIDGTRSLGAGKLVLSSLKTTWSSAHSTSLLAVQNSFGGIDLLNGAAAAVLSYPAFAVAGGLGLILVVLGRVPRRERYVRQDQI